MLNSWNEWDSLQEIIVGSATNANWPSNDPVFSKESEKTKWKETPVPSGRVPQWIVDEANEDLQILTDTLEKFGVIVYRPTDMDFPKLGGMYNYCPRDRLIVAGDILIDPTMMYPCRDMESEALWFAFLKARNVYRMPRDKGYVLDAANILRLDDKWLCLLSNSGNVPAVHWLQEKITDMNIIIETCNFYSGVHIDSTIAALNNHTAIVNGSRVSPESLPHAIRKWDIIWVNEVEERSFYEYPYASKWIGLNVLSIDSQTVIVDKIQTKLIKELEKRKFTVIPLELRHSRTLGGGFHCVTLDLVRKTK